MRRLVLILLLLLCGCNLSNHQQFTPTPVIPMIQFQFPANNVSVTEGEDLQIQLLAQDSVGIAKVELQVDNQPIQVGKPVDKPAVPVFTVDMDWIAKGVGLHALRATAYRLDGTASDPTLINVNVTAASLQSTPTPTPTP